MKTKTLCNGKSWITNTIALIFSVYTTDIQKSNEHWLIQFKCELRSF